VLTLFTIEIANEMPKAGNPSCKFGEFFATNAPWRSCCASMKTRSGLNKTIDLGGDS